MEVGSKTAGRPRDLAKRQLMLDAAKRHFLRLGVEGASMEAIAAEAGVSKPTLYRSFPDKVSLFEEIANSEAARLSSALGPWELSDESLPDQLVAIGTALLSLASDPELAGFDRIMASEAHRDPELARLYYASGTGRIHQFLAAILNTAAGQELICLHSGDTPSLVAEDLLGLWQGVFMMELRLGVAPTLSVDQIEARVARAVTVFLRAYTLPGAS